MKSLVDLLQRGLERDPEARVATSGEEQMSWAELDARSDQVGCWLESSGVRPGERVALALDRSLEALVGIFGVWKVGAAYVPLDPMSPPDRNRSLVRDCGAGVVLSRDKWMRRIAPLEATLSEQGRGAVLSLTDLSGLPKGRPVHDLRGQDTLAALLYTSGSTGAAKGVMLSHRAIRAFVEWAAERLELGTEDRVSGVSPLQFDLSTLEIFGAMSAGALICIAPPAASAFPESLARFLEQEEISCWYSVPSVLMRLAEADLEAHDLSMLRSLPFAGEVFPPAQLGALMERLPGARFHNFFGPTESNVCAAAVITEPPSGDSAACIGAAASGACLRVCDESGEVVPVGSRGELWVSGPSLMSGYWGDATATERALIHHEGQLWLRTGDEVHEQEGLLWFHGRLDSMLKIGGFRLHPEAIEQVLCAHLGVRAARVGKVGDELWAWVETSELDSETLRRRCAGKFPAYMVPAHIEIVDSLPRTDRGKIQR